MDEPDDIILNEMSDRERQKLWDFTYLWNLRTQRNKIKNVAGDVTTDNHRSTSDYKKIL